MKLRARGFTLLEIIVVLGIIGSLGAAIIPNLAISNSSQMRIVTVELITTMRAAYDAAVLESQIHRLVIKPKTGEYWAEALPPGYQGRPARNLDEREAQTKAEVRAKFLEEIEKALAEPRKSKEDEKKNYSWRSIILEQYKVLKPVVWKEIDDPILFRRSLTGAIFFKSVATQEQPEPLIFDNATEKDVAYIYFFPSGEATVANIQLATLGDNKQINEQGPRQTLKLDALSGRTEITEGLVEPSEVFGLRR